ncbi:DUF4179 domain-containing protein [Rummeliibacillus sp. NPDC094406]|uniref:DUF4179 domain-containing protein n=1 Tax=Rummeliibacillus sp. NPDC094406 TaxID=3364511 RepID=UPI0038258D51
MTKNYKDWTGVNVEDIEPVEVSETEKQRVKQYVLGSKSKRKTSTLYRNIVAAAVITIGVVTTTGFAFPSVASQIPFMKNVISYFQDEDNFYEKYDEFSTTIGQVQTSNGVSVMIDNAVYDGTSITISYAVETKTDLGDGPMIAGSPSVENAIGAGGSSYLKKISATKYVGVDKITPMYKGDGKGTNTVQVSWQPESFTNTTSGTKVKGDWSFDFSLDKVEGKTQLVNQTSESKGLKIIIQSFEMTDVSTVLNYQQTVDSKILEKWKDVSTILDVVDDVGTTYYIEGNGGISHNQGAKSQFSDTMNVINEKATKLIVTPTVILSLGEGKGHEERKMKPIEIDLKKGK